ncbi:hypothetical protein B0H13DRAFT_2494823 [Mycena leptocephala]|nr:hypothetical protein B0H13DRAFT_2494823 [Mycena leptocephala]
MILRPLFLRSQIRNASGNGGGGKCVPCGDAVQRVLFPRLPVLTLDGEEACTCAATRGALADFPCPRCLARHDQLHDFFSTNLEFPLRTTVTMKDVYDRARNERFKWNAEDLLQRHGLHLTENAFWSLCGSDPYEAISYDTLHADDSGKWGKHLWPLLQEVLSRSGRKGMITANMARVPRWPGLKHFENVTTKDINDGQSWLDIEKKLTEEYDKSFDFPKQHALYHSSPDIRNKGPHSIYCTRVNERFHQESREIYTRLNKRNLDKQASKYN